MDGERSRNNDKNLIQYNTPLDGATDNDDFIQINAGRQPSIIGSIEKRSAISPDKDQTISSKDDLEKNLNMLMGIGKSMNINKA